MIPSRDIGDQRILHADWIRGTPGHIKPKLVASAAAFPCWLTTCKKTQDINWFFPEKLMIKISCSLTGPETNWPHPTNRDIVDQRILQPNWMRNTPSHTQPKVIASNTTLRGSVRYYFPLETISIPKNL